MLLVHNRCAPLLIMDLGVPSKIKLVSLFYVLARSFFFSLVWCVAFFQFIHFPFSLHNFAQTRILRKYTFPFLFQDVVALWNVWPGGVLQ